MATPLRPAAVNPGGEATQPPAIQQGSITLTIDGRERTFDVFIEAVDEHGNPVENRDAFKVHDKAMKLIQTLAQDYAQKNETAFDGREVVLDTKSLPLGERLESKSKEEVFATLDAKGRAPITSDSIAPFTFDEPTLHTDKIDELSTLLKTESDVTLETMKTKWEAVFGSGDIDVEDLPETDDASLSLENKTALLSKMKETVRGFYAGKAEADTKFNWIDLESWDPTEETSFEDHLKAHVATGYEAWNNCPINTVGDLWKKIFNDDDNALRVITPPTPPTEPTRCEVAGARIRFVPAAPVDPTDEARGADHRPTGQADDRITGLDDDGDEDWSDAWSDDDLDFGFGAVPTGRKEKMD